MRSLSSCPRPPIAIVNADAARSEPESRRAEITGREQRDQMGCGTSAGKARERGPGSRTRTVHRAHLLRPARQAMPDEASGSRRRIFFHAVPGYAAGCLSAVNLRGRGSGATNISCKPLDADDSADITTGREVSARHRMQTNNSLRQSQPARAPDARRMPTHRSGFEPCISESNRQASRFCPAVAQSPLPLQRSPCFH